MRRAVRESFMRWFFHEPTKPGAGEQWAWQVFARALVGVPLVAFFLLAGTCALAGPASASPNKDGCKLKPTKQLSLDTRGAIGCQFENAGGATKCSEVATLLATIDDLRRDLAMNGCGCTPDDVNSRLFMLQEAEYRFLGSARPCPKCVDREACDEAMVPIPYTQNGSCPPRSTSPSSSGSLSSNGADGPITYCSPLDGWVTIAALEPHTTGKPSRIVLHGIGNTGLEVSSKRRKKAVVFLPAFTPFHFEAHTDAPGQTRQWWDRVVQELKLVVIKRAQAGQEEADDATVFLVNALTQNGHEPEIVNSIADGCRYARDGAVVLAPATYVPESAPTYMRIHEVSRYSCDLSLPLSASPTLLDADAITLSGAAVKAAIDRVFPGDGG